MIVSEWYCDKCSKTHEVCIEILPSRTMEKWSSVVCPNVPQLLRAVKARENVLGELLDVCKALEPYDVKISPHDIYLWWDPIHKVITDTMVRSPRFTGMRIPWWCDECNKEHRQVIRSYGHRSFSWNGYDSRAEWRACNAVGEINETARHHLQLLDEFDLRWACRLPPGVQHE